MLRKHEPEVPKKVERVPHVIPIWFWVLWFVGYLYTFGYIFVDIPTTSTFFEKLMYTVITFICWPSLLGTAVRMG